MSAPLRILPRSSRITIKRFYASKPRAPQRKTVPTSQRPPSKPSKSSKSSSTPPPYKPKREITASSSETITLPSSNRTLGFSISGPALASKAAPTLLLFHGFPGSRLDALSIADSPSLSHIRIIGIDRPGIGLSSPQSNRTLLDWPNDVLALTDYLGIERFSVIGGSAGGMYALACARAIPHERLAGVGVVAGFAPDDYGDRDVKGGLEGKERFLMDNPRLLKLQTWWNIGRHINHRNPAVRRNMLVNMAKEMGYGARDVNDSVLESLAEPFRQGVDGYVEEALLLQKPWGFDLEDVDDRKVRLWYGEDDVNTPVAMGRWMVQRLKGGTLKTFKGVDHFSIMAKHGDRIIMELMQSG